MTLGKSIGIAVVVALIVDALLKLRRTTQTPTARGTVTIEPIVNVGPAGPDECPSGTIWAPLNQMCIPVQSPLPPFGSPGTTPSNPGPGFVTVAGETVFDPSTSLVI